MNAFPSELIYQSQMAHNQELLEAAGCEQRARAVPQWIGVLRLAGWVYSRARGGSPRPTPVGSNTATSPGRLPARRV
jgi:hypothetical protein